MAIKIDIKATNLPWGCLETKDGLWVAVCEPLKLTVESETWADLMQDIGLTLDAMLRDLLTTNDLDTFLREQGWQAVGPIPNPLEGPVVFDVPFIPQMLRQSA